MEAEGYICRKIKDWKMSWELVNRDKSQLRVEFIIHTVGVWANVFDWVEKDGRKTDAPMAVLILEEDAD
jgi:hypothetical protein